MRLVKSRQAPAIRYTPQKNPFKESLYQIAAQIKITNDINDLHQTLGVDFVENFS